MINSLCIFLSLSRRYIGLHLIISIAFVIKINIQNAILPVWTIFKNYVSLWRFATSLKSRCTEFKNICHKLLHQEEMSRMRSHFLKGIGTGIRSRHITRGPKWPIVVSICRVTKINTLGLYQQVHREWRRKYTFLNYSKKKNILF